MKNTHFGFLHSLALLVLLTTVGGARAQTTETKTPEQKGMDRFTEKLRSFAGGDPKRAGKVRSGTLILHQPGKVIALTEAEKKNPAAVAEYFHVLCNTLPAASFSFEKTGKNLEEVWEVILRFGTLTAHNPSQTEPRVSFNQLQEDWDNNKIEGLGGHALRTLQLNPAFSEWEKEAGWTKVTLKDESYEMSFEVKRIEIYRPWLSVPVLTRTFWEFSSDPKTVPFLNLSSGLGITDSKPRPGEVMPLLPMELLLGRNVSVSGKFSDTYLKTILSGKPVSCGPFSMGGGSEKVSVSEDKISFTSTQVLGVYAYVLEKLPNPEQHDDKD